MGNTFAIEAITGLQLFTARSVVVLVDKIDCPETSRFQEEVDFL